MTSRSTELEINTNAKKTVRNIGNPNNSRVEVFTYVATVTEKSSDDDNNNVARGQGSSGVARVATVRDSKEEDIPRGYCHENIIALFGCKNRNKSLLGNTWLSKQGFAQNHLKGRKYYICLEMIEKNEIVCNIQYNGILKGPLHKNCIQGYIKQNETSCP